MKERQINLALQGGGSHGAYTWGTLDRLLEEEDIKINTVSGTSAGAMNAVVMADGYREGGRDLAKKKLREFWQSVSDSAAYPYPGAKSFSQYLPSMASMWGFNPAIGIQWMDMLTRTFSPYELNPYNLNPLRDILNRIINWERVNAGGDVRLFVTATSVRTGQPRVFRCQEVTENVLLASACLPFYFQAIEIDGEPFWDGGYMGNPSIWPLVYNSDIRDVLLVQINPVIREGVPRTSQDIINRINEITFNSSLIAEMRAINFVSKLVKENHLGGDKYRDVLMHMIPSPHEELNLDASSKAETDWPFLLRLFEAGRAKMDEWLKENKQAIGKCSTLDIEKAFLFAPDNHKRHDA